MATATVSDVRLAHPELTEVVFDDAAVTRAIDVATDIFSFDTDAICDLAAHVLTLAAEDTAETDDGAGVILSEWIGNRRVQYRSAAGEGDEWYGRSSYGRQFLQRRRSSAVGMPRVF